MKTTSVIQEAALIAFVIGTALACIALWLLTNLPIAERRAAAEYVLNTAKVGFVALTALLVIGAVAGLLFVVWVLLNRGLIWHSDARIKLAEATRLAREAHLTITVAPPGHQIVASEVGGLSIVHKPLHLAPGKVNGAPLIYAPEERRAWLAFNFAHGTRRLQEQELLQLPAPEAIPELLSILNTAQRVLIVGPSNAGKTTLLQWVASGRNGAVAVIDTQAYPDKWGKAKVIGSGSNHVEVSRALDGLIELMVKRYKEISEGLVREGEHPKLTVIIDEWMAIVHQCHNATDTIMRLLTESRKAAMSIVIGSHSDRVRSLGLDGRGDLRDGFLIVRLWEDDDPSMNSGHSGVRKATYDYGRGERPARLPGRFELPQESNLIEIEAITMVRPTDEELEQADKEARIIEMLRQGISNKEIAREVFNKPSLSGDNFYLVKDLKRKLLLDDDGYLDDPSGIGS